MASENGGANFLVGFFVGAALGAMGALLLAPKSGRELRETLADESKKLRGRAEGAFSDMRERGSEVFEKTREGLSETAETAKKAAKGVKNVISHSG